MIKTTIRILFSILIFIHVANAEDHFVSPSGGGSYSGADWSNSWSLANLNNAANWHVDANTDDNKIGPGDTVYLSGSTEQSVYDGMVIASSGTVEHPITIKPGAAHLTLSSGHSGTVIFTGATTDYGIDITGKSFITINGNDGQGNKKIRVSGSTQAGLYVAPGEATGIKGLFLTIDHNGSSGTAYQDNNILIENILNTGSIKITSSDICFSPYLNEPDDEPPVNLPEP